MKNQIFLRIQLCFALLLLSFSLSFSQVTFRKTYGIGSNLDFNFPSNIRQTSDGGYILSGSSLSMPDFNGSVVKLQADGTVSWAKTFDGVVSGSFPFTYDDAASFEVNDIKQTTDGGYIITGGVSPALFSLGFSYSDAFLIKLDASGNISWSRKYGGSELDYGSFVIQTSDGGYLVTGSTESFSPKDTSNIFLFKTNSTGILTWNQTYELSALYADKGTAVAEVAGGYICAGYTDQFYAGDTLSDIVLLKTNTAGALQWIRTYGEDADYERAMAIKVATSGDLLVTGSTNATSSGINNVLIMKVNHTNGNVIMSTSYYTDFLSVADEGNSIIETSDGGLGLIGFSVTIVGGMKSFLIKTDITANTVTLGRHYDNGPMGMQLFSSGVQTSDNGFLMVNMGPGALGWDFGVIKTDALGVSGCNEAAITPMQEACSYTPVTPAYTPYGGSVDNAFSALNGGVAVTPQTDCCTPLPNAAGAITGSLTVCQGQNGVSYSIPAVSGAIGYTWTLPSGAGIASGANTNSITVNFASNASSGTISVYATNDCGDGTPSNISVTVSQFPVAAGSITGTTPVCQGQNSVTFSVPSITYAASYVWGLPPGATISSGSGTNTITVDFSGSSASGTVSVYGSNTCGNGTSATFNVTVQNIPVAAGVISGTTPVCQGQTGVVFSVPAITDATTYVWGLPTGATVVGGANTNSITVDFSGSAISGNFTVYGTNSCGNGTSSSYNITVNTIPDPAGTITGTSVVCQGDQGVAYSVPAITGAIGYDWSLPVGASIASGTNTNSITVDFSGSAISGDIVVVGTNDCGSGASSTFAVTVNTVPDAAGSITGPAIVCQGNTGISFFIPVITGADSYSWTLSSGASIASGTNTESITVDFSIAAVSGDIIVYGSNMCGGGVPSLLSLVVDSVPDSAGVITGVDTVCQGDAGVVYSIAAISGATGYDWNLPAGASIVGGTNTNSVTIDFSGSAVSGDITVSGTNDCGNGAVSTFSVFVNTIPNTPTIIYGATIACQGATGNVYSIDAIANATSYVWSVPTGVTIVNGQGTDSITVDFDITASSGDITVYGTNACGSGFADTLSIQLLDIPDDAGSITGQFKVCQGETGVVYTVPPINNATDYFWTLPPGASITSGDNTNSIVVSFSDTAQSGSFFVYGSNNCGDGLVSPGYAIQVDLLPFDAGTITGDTIACEWASGVIYSVDPIGYSNSYQWNLPAGAVIVGNADTNVVTVSFPVGTVSGDISVYGVNGCGNGQSSSISITVYPIPNAVITGDLSICEKDSLTLVASGGSTYLWSTGETSETLFEQPSVSTTYSVTVTNSITGCYDTISVYVIVTPLPIPSAGADTSICATDSLNLNASGGVAYIWTPVDGLSNPALPNPFASPDSTTWYYVEVANTAGCTATDSVLLTVFQLPLFSVSQTNLDCKGDNDGEAYLTVVSDDYPPYSFEWSTGSTDTAIVNLTAGLYTIIVTDGNGCRDAEIINIVEPNLLNTVITGTNESCFGKNDGSATVVITGGTPPYNPLTWSDNNTTHATTVTGLSPDIWYYLIVFDNNLCMTEDSIMVGSPEQMGVEIISTTKPNCFNGSDGGAVVAVTGGTIPYLYLWSDENAQTSATASGLSAGTYEVTVTDSHSCEVVDSATIIEPSQLTITFESDSTTCIDALDGKITLMVYGGVYPYSYSWNPSVVGDSVATDLVGGSYIVTVTDDHDCYISDSILVHQSSEACLNIPDVFTPNNDSYNDYWEIVGIEYYPNVHVQIYNRWGSLLFESIGYNDPWDGTYKGKEVAVGAYLYIIDLNTGREPEANVLTIIR